MSCKLISDIGHMPRKIISVGLSYDRTWFHWFESAAWIISATLLAGNGFNSYLFLYEAQCKLVQKKLMKDG